MRRRARGPLMLMGAGVAAVALACALAAPSGGLLAPAVRPTPAAPGPVHTPAEGTVVLGTETTPVALTFTTSVQAVRREQVTYSWRPGCPVHYSDLRLVRATHWGFDKRPHTGAIVVHRTLVADVVATLKKLFDAGYPIARMQLVDVYRADDDASMAANNTSAFNCRPVAGTESWSEHSYGRAIDLNPVQNPYVSGGGTVYPPSGARFADRSKQAAGMIHDGDEVAAAWAAVGWKWGGGWQSAKDYQHFSTTGR